MHNTDELNRFLAGVEKRAYSMAMVTVKNSEDALDIVQDVMLTLATKYAQKPAAEWKPLFYKILRNRITDFHRKQQRSRGIFAWFSGADDDPLDAAAAPASSTPVAQTEAQNNTAAISQALAELPDRQRQAFMLRAWEGLGVRETAAAMGCSQGSVKTHYSRAIAGLQTRLGRLGEP